MSLLAAAVVCSGCGVKNTQSSATSVVDPVDPAPSTTTPVLLTLSATGTDSGLVSFFSNIAQVQITPRQGDPVTLYSSASTFELTRLPGTTRFLAMTGIPPGSYTKINVSIAEPLFTYINSTGETVFENSSYYYTGSAEIDFPELLTVDTAPLDIDLDFNLDTSAMLNATAATVTLTPTFTSTELPIITSSPTIGTGLLETISGTVTQYANGVLGITTDIGQTALGCNIASSTSVVNDSASSELPRGALVRVDMAAQTDSSFNCLRIENVNSSNVAYAMAGTVNSFRGGLAPYQLTLAMQEGTGAGVSPNFIGQGINVNFDSPAATFAIDWDGMDQTNLGFTPKFSAPSFFPGQYVEASSSMPLVTTGNDVGSDVAGSMTTVAAMEAQQVTLRKQPEEGTPSNVATDAYGVTRFALAVPASSVFAQYTALPTEPSGFVPTIQVVVPAGATINGSLTTPMAGAPAGSSPYVQVRGLLFLNGSTYTLVAQRVTATLPPSQVSPTQSFTSAHRPAR
jgi:hypothetical protein